MSVMLTFKNRIVRTFCKMCNEAMRSLINQVAFPRNTDSRQDIVASAHDLPDAGFGKLVENACRAGLQLILEYDKSDKIQIGFCLLSLHLLDFDPVQLVNVLSSNPNDTESAMCIICQKFLIITRD